MSKRIFPAHISSVNSAQNGRLVAQAALRNVEPLCDLLVQWTPTHGKALEIASGTGQHVQAFARCLPEVHWQPSEVEPDRRESINAYTASLTNVSDAVILDATEDGWSRSYGGQDLIVLINLTHLISWSETQKILTEVALALNPNGRFVLYGPFMRAGRLISDGDQRFHQALVQQDAEIGYKNDADITNFLRSQGLTLLQAVEMPANNLAFVVEKPAV